MRAEGEGRGEGEEVVSQTTKEILLSAVDPNAPVLTLLVQLDKFFSETLWKICKIFDEFIVIIANISAEGCYIVLPSVKLLYKFKVSGGRCLHRLFDMLGDANEDDKGMAQTN